MHKIHHTIPSVDYMKELSLLQHWENTAIAHPCPWIHVHVYIYVTCRARLRNHKRDFVFLWYISLWVRIPDSHSSSHCFKITNWLAASVLSSNRSVRIGTMLLALSTYSPQKSLTTDKMAGLIPEFLNYPHGIKRSIQFWRRETNIFFFFRICPSLTFWRLWHFFVHAGLFWCFRNPPNSHMDYRIVNLRMWSFCMHIYTRGTSVNSLIGRTFVESVQNLTQEKSLRAGANR